MWVHYGSFLCFTILLHLDICRACDVVMWSFGFVFTYIWLVVCDDLNEKARFTHF